MNATMQQRGAGQTGLAMPLSVVFALLLSLRIINALTVQTFFQPDEYFQALEPAWQIAFGEGSGAWITWEWREALRSSIHPMLFAAVYRIAMPVASLLHLGRHQQADLLIAGPKIAQACVAAIGDLYTWRLATKIYDGENVTSYAALALTSFSPWQWHASVRTFSNSLETTLTIVGLYYWPWQWFLRSNISDVTGKKQEAVKPDAAQMVQEFKNFLTTGEPPAKVAGGLGLALQRPPPSSLRTSLGLAAIACILRPTNTIIWATITLSLLSRYGGAGKAQHLLANALLSASAVLAISTAVDVAFYHAWVFPPLKFLYVNVFQAVAGFYGTNRIDYYFTEGLPLLLTTASPFAVIGVWQSLRPGVDKPGLRDYIERQCRHTLAVAVLTTVLAMTMIGHKEVRFIYPLLPILHILAAKPAANFFRSVSTDKLRLALLMFILTINVYIAAYVSLVHQRGVVDVVHYLRQEQEARFGHSRASNVTVGFLMPCHSTPWRSHFVHPEITGWALTCEPPLGLSVEDRRAYEDEADIFYDYPAGWIDDNLKDHRRILMKHAGEEIERAGDDARRDWPEYLVFFEHLEPIMNSVLDRTVYEECWRGFNTHWHDDSRRRGDVIVWCARACDWSGKGCNSFLKPQRRGISVLGGRLH